MQINGKGSTNVISPFIMNSRIVNNACSIINGNVIRNVIMVMVRKNIFLMFLQYFIKYLFYDKYFLESVLLTLFIFYANI